MSQEAEELHAKADGEADRSERIATTRALRDERRRWRRWFDAAPAAYLLTNAYGAIQEANPRAAVLVGVPPRFLRGKPLPALVAPQDRARVRRLLVALAGDTAPGGAADDPAVEVELRLQPARRVAGPSLAVRASVGAVRDERGKLLGVAWMLQVPTQPSAPLPPPGRRRRGNAWRAQVEPRRLLEATIEATPALLHVDAAGLLLVESNGVLGPAAATDPGVAALEALQTDLDQGPALAAARGLETVSIRDLGVDRRWRRLGWVAADHRVRALLAVPVLADEDRPDDTVAAGVVELVIHHPHRWTGEEVRAAVAHGATLSRLLRAGLAAGQANERLAHLLRVLDSRVAVEQAKGMLMERDQLLPAQAFRVLRAMAKLSNRRISDVAADVIADRAR